MQASVLSLYDPDRSQVIRKYGDTATWGDFIAALQPVLNAAKTNGAGLRILTQSTTSPTFGTQMQTLLAQYPGMKWHQWEAVNRDGAREGGRLAFGRYVNTHYDFTKANVVVSLGSDFLGEGPGHLRYARDFMSRRKVRTVGVAPTQSINRLYAIEGSMSSTGSVADHRIPVKPSQMEEIARAILAGTAGSNAVINTLIKDLQTNRGASVVIAGEEQPAVVHALAYAINSSLGNIGTTVLVTDPIEAAPVNQLASLQELVTDINSGIVQALIVLGGNPVFDAPADLQFTKAYEKVPFRAHQSLYYDETSLRSHWHIPETHYLETWGDARGHDGTISIIQPLIAPLYNGRSAHEIIGALIGGLDQTPYQTVRAYWQTQGGTDATWRKWLHDGVIAGSAMPAVLVAATAPPATASQPSTGIEIELRHDPTIYDGRFANNGWLQELPKPQTKITWDNVLLVGPKTAAKLGYDPEERDRLVNEKWTRFAEVSYRGVNMRLPIWVVPGYAEDVATIYFGYGREKSGKIGTGAGFNTYPLRFSNALHGGPGARITMSDSAPREYRVACTQEHQNIDPKVVGERGLIRATTFEGYKKNPKFAADPHGGEGGHDESMYKSWDYSDKHAWAMVIDTSICTGCNGCVIACQSENNIAIVGKDEVVRERELHWLRIDRYYRGDAEHPEVFHEPVPCMQCENAPCEPVCPVAATSHSEDGLNDMTYNRCVGTRYCSNNCPYKVRRFNFFGYSDYDTPSLKPMRNPDVTVRTRGVMEKCTYCVQRINLAKIDAEKQGRRVRDGEVTTACQQACPTQAITFGDMNDKTSEVAKLKAEPQHYALLEELQTRPRTTYLGAIRNPHPDLDTQQAASGHE
jgi:molybdopterin-containing oxidoreductase family iron-sulfur binding subunit